MFDAFTHLDRMSHVDECDSPEIMSGTSLLDRVFCKAVSERFLEMLRDYFLPRSVATQAKWSNDFYAAQMEKGEESMRIFSGADKILRVCDSFCAPKSKRQVDRTY